MIETGIRLERCGMIAGTDGNFSVRLADGRVLITPSGRPKGRLVPEDLVEVDLDGNRLKGKNPPSSELAMHLFVYRKRPEVNACVHSHAPHATAFAVAGLSLPPHVLPEVVLTVGPVPLTVYAPPGTDSVPQALAPFVENHDAFLLRNHGLLTIGRSLEEACGRHETVEHFARIVTIARQLGQVETIPAEDVSRLEAMRRGSREVRDDNI